MKLVVLCFSIILLTACAAPSVSMAPYRPQIPPRPTLTVQPDVIDCQVVNGQRGRCVNLWEPDLKTMVQWGLGLERELKAACLALGGSPKECRTEVESK